MHRHIITIAMLLFTAIAALAGNKEVEKMLSRMASVTNYERIEKNDTTRSYYLLKFTQLIDPNNENAGTFEQRVMLGHRGFDRPTVIVTEGREVPETTIQQAAVVAAYNSKARESSLVPVDYTEIRNVKKPSGAAPGKAIYEHYKTAYVRPAQFENLFENK